MPLAIVSSIVLVGVGVFETRILPEKEPQIIRETIIREVRVPVPIVERIEVSVPVATLAPEAATMPADSIAVVVPILPAVMPSPPPVAPPAPPTIAPTPPPPPPPPAPTPTPCAAHERPDPGMHRGQCKR